MELWKEGGRREDAIPIDREREGWVDLRLLKIVANSAEEGGELKCGWRKISRNRTILTYEVLGRGSEVRGTRYKFGPMRRQR